MRRHDVPATEASSPFDQICEALSKEGNEFDSAATEAILVKYPSVLAEDGQGLALLDSAAHSGNIQALAFLIRHGVDINDTLSTSLFEGPICGAAMNGHHKAVKWMIDHGAEINIAYDSKRITRNGAIGNPTFDGIRNCSPFSGACIWGHLECVKVLVENGGDINACWCDKNPLSLAEEFGHKAIADYLRSKGAKLPRELYPNGGCPGTEFAKQKQPAKKASSQTRSSTQKRKKK
jgi:ankyrin repeat protein